MASRNQALAPMLSYQGHLLKLETVKQDAAVRTLIASLGRMEWLEAAAFVVAGLPSSRDPLPAERRFLDNLERAQVQIYNDQLGGEGFGESGFFYKSAVLPGLELYAFKHHASPGAQARVAKLVDGALDPQTAAALLDREFRAAFANDPPQE
jgi:hypothetical protein